VRARGTHCVHEEHTKFGAFDDFWNPSRGPIGLILYTLLYPTRSRKHEDMSPIGAREGSQKSSKPRPTTYDLLPTTYDLRPTTYDLRPTAYYLRPTTYYLRPTTYDLRPTTYYLRPTTYDLLPTTYRVFGYCRVFEYCRVFRYCRVFEKIEKIIKISSEMAEIEHFHSKKQ